MKPYKTMDIQDNRPRLTCNDGCSISVQASRTHYSTPREDHPDWHWSRFECVEVGYPADAAGVGITMPEDWAAYADYPPDGNTSKVYAFVPVRLVCEWIQAHGGLVADDAPPAPPEPEATIEQLAGHVVGMGLLLVITQDGRVALAYADPISCQTRSPLGLRAPEPSDYRTVGEWLAMTRRDIRDLI
jgi:hypothetical protein